MYIGLLLLILKFKVIEVRWNYSAFPVSSACLSTPCSTVKVLLKTFCRIICCVWSVYLVTNTKPHQLLITKVKKFGDSSSFTGRSQWTVEQLRQVNGINPNKVSRIHAFYLIIRYMICININSICKCKYILNKRLCTITTLSGPKCKNITCNNVQISLSFIPSSEAHV